MRQLKRIALFMLTAAIFFQCKHQDKIYSIAEEEVQDEMDGMEQAMRQEFLMTRDPQLNYIPTERLAGAKTYMDALIQSGRTNALSWTERGPNNIGGRTRAILIDKNDVSGNTVFAASVSGGMFKSTNFTSASPTWTVVNDFLPNLAITCIVQDPANLNVMYAGTGEGWFNVDAVRGLGIYKSTNGGTTWTVLPSTIQTTPADSTFEFVQDMAIGTNGAVYAALRNQTGFSRGVKRSMDGGTTWTQVLGAPLPGFVTGRAADLEVASNGDVYATMGVFSPGSLWKSEFAVNGSNTGALGTWVNVTPPWVVARQRLEIAVAPSNPQRLYVLGQDSATQGQVIGLWRSITGGLTWDSVGSSSALNGSSPQAWYNLTMAVDPNNEMVLVTAALSIAKSTDAGVNWTTISGGVHVDHHMLLYDGSTKLVNGNDGGVYYTSNADAGSPTFTNKNSGYNVTQYYATDYHPTNVNYFLAGAQDNGSHKFANAGMNSVTIATGGDGGFCHIDQTDGQIQVTSFFGSQYAISNNGGASFTTRNFGSSLGQFINPSDYDDNQDLFYAGGSAGQYTFISNLVPATSAILNTRPISNMGSREMTAVKVDPFANNTIWIGASFGSALPQILKVSNASSASPTVVTAATLGAITNATVSSIDVDPANANHIIATLSNFGVVSVWESTNGGTSFVSIEGNLPDMPIRWAIFAPPNAQLNGSSGGNGGILLGTELGVWTTSVINGSLTQWIPNNSGLANVSTHMLKFRASDNLVAAATHGRGLFTTILPTVVTGLPNDPVTKNFIKYTFTETDKLHVVIGTLQTKTITLQLVDMKGRVVHSSQEKYQNTAIDLSRLQKGSYIIKITGNNKENYVRQFIR